MGKPLPVRPLIHTLIRLLVLCLVVGVIMTILGIRPAYLLNDLQESFWRAWAILAVVVHWAATYIILGASVVVPVALIVFLLRFLRR